MAESTPLSAFKFPTSPSEQFPAFNTGRGESSSSPNGLYVDNTAGTSGERWTSRGNGSIRKDAARHGRQKSLSEAIRTIRGRNGSVSQNAHEIAEALRPPVSPSIIALCGLWYMSSIMSNTSTKTILTAFPKPVTLTLIQFAFVSSWCLLLGWLAKVYPRLRVMVPALKNGIQYPTKDIIYTTLPLTFFQISGHILSSDATSRIPVSLVHTIKGLSPLFTVLAYTFVFNIRYSWTTYVALVPLLLGVAMACSTDLNGNFVGIMMALASALLFVTQNIVSKKIFNESAMAEQDGISKSKKPDKLNLLCYSTGLAFLFTAPIWIFSEGFGLIGDLLSDASINLSNKPGSVGHGRLALEYVFNGSFHFLQSMVAFSLLSMISPVTYSVASLIKRVFVICFAIVWFGNKMTSVQAIGIALTFVGLYLYDRTSDASKGDRKARAMQLRDQEALLPLSTTNTATSDSSSLSPTLRRQSIQFDGGGRSGALPPSMPNGHAQGEEKKHDEGSRPGRSMVNTASIWLPPGTKQEQTWTPEDAAEALCRV